MGIRVEAFELLRKIESTSAGTAYIPEDGSLKRDTAGKPPKTMRPFAHVAGVRLHLVGEAPRSSHTLTYEFEAPDGSIGPLLEARISDFMAWMSQGPNTVAVANAHGAGQAKPIPPATMDLAPGEVSDGFLGVELRLRTPGLHQIHLLVDGKRAQSASVMVDYPT